MSTSYDDIYSRFMGQIEDYGLLDDMVNDPTYYEEILLSFLKSSIPKFSLCAKDLTNRDDVNKIFNIILDELEQEILSILMVVEYLSPKIIRSDLLESRLGSKDFRQWSPANQIKEVRELRDSKKNEASSLIKEYYYSQGYE